MTYIIQTDRLRLREFDLGDTPFILDLLNSAGWLRYIGDRNVKTEEQAVQYLKNGPIKSYLENGYGLYLVERTEDGTPVGMCGIIKRDTLENPDIGFAFLPAYNGKGYAFEIASATVAYAKEQLQLPQLDAITVADNEKSIRLLEKIGLKYLEPIRLSPDSAELLLYRTYEEKTAD